MGFLRGGEVEAAVKMRSFCTSNAGTVLCISNGLLVYLKVVGHSKRLLSCAQEQGPGSSLPVD
jgi:hypothetical protein